MVPSVVGIQLTRGKVALVDLEDFARVDQYKWYAECNQNTWYAKRIARIDGKRQPIYMHIFILGIKGIDHINNDGLDNRRLNLRPATQRLNNANARIRRDNTSGFKGVTKLPSGRWQVKVACKYIGSYATIDEAVQVYRDTAREVFGEYANV